MTAPPIRRRNRGPRIEKLQRAIKENLTKRGFEQWADGIIVDGVPGQMTFKMARLNGSMRGLSKRQLRRIANGVITRHVELILLGEKERTNAMKRRERERAHRFRMILHELKNPPRGDGIVIFDGKPCAKEIAFWLQKARENGWGGVLVSGVRSPEHSEDLCFGMCGAPSCPGTCAGRSSNHCCPPSFKCLEGEGAADCSDYINLANILRRLGAPIFNALPRDLVHFSFTGN